ncbi:DUF986 domain-containing protein [Listeria booriae]|uniref:Lmo0779 family protein n=1 Tax=Listeria booriae TaxID=1552123 RepID=UPI00164D1781|nr:Lmo0779 family protein [Listeria booriae]MBC6135467.1 DUF986 domain-containing protein [Listeria booriae]MBC6151621.1 DUF986 domain-containing protein [Listeria booriae]
MSFDATNIFLLIMIAGAFLFSVYDGVVLHFWKGKTVLSIPLRSRGKWDGYIFVGLITLLFISNAFLRHGPTSTSVLLAILGVLFFYICFIRKGRIIFKEHGFFYALLFFEYKKMERINLSEDGVLVIETGRQRLLLFARNEQDLAEMLQIFTERS